MAATATIAFRVKPEIKKRADALFARLGMTTSTAMNVLLMQTLAHRGFAAPVALGKSTSEKSIENSADPKFEYDHAQEGAEPSVAAEPDSFGDEDWPNAETRAVLDRYLEGTEPMHGPFKNVDEMFAELTKD